jgi:MYXO-CTERM domain-containing protein
MEHPDAFATFVKSLKADPSKIIVGLIVGFEVPVTTSLAAGGYVQLEPSCITPTGSAAPAVRLIHFAEQFPGRHFFSPLCDGATTGLDVLGNFVRTTVAAIPGGADAGPADASPGDPDAPPVDPPDAAPGTPDAAPGTPDGAPGADAGGGGGDDGCGCRAGGRGQQGGLALLVGLAFLLARRRRP